MTETIIFFVIMFSFFALYYLKFLCSYFWEAKLIPEKKKTAYVQIVQLKSYPLQYKCDFMVCDIELKGICESYKWTREQAIRNIASRRCAEAIRDLVVEDVYNQAFHLVEVDKRTFYSPEWAKENRFYIDFQILPILRETRNYDSYTGLKLVQ